MDTRTLGRLLVAFLLLAGIHAVAANGYQISSSDATTVPERTVDFQGNAYTLDTLIRADAGDSISIDVSAPDAIYRVYMYNSDEQIVDSQRGDGSGSFTFDLTGYAPGSYMLTVYENGDYKALQPVLVKGYEVSTTAPSQVDADDTFQVDIDVTKTDADDDPPIVEAIIANDDTDHTVTATQSGDSYTASVDAAQLSTGEYTLYGVVRRTETVFGQEELVAMTSGQSVQIGADPTPTPTSPPPTSTPTETPTTTPATPTTTPDQPTPTTTPATPTVTPSTPTATPSSPTSTITSTPDTPTDSPATSTPTATPTSTPSLPDAGSPPPSDPPSSGGQTAPSETTSTPTTTSATPTATGSTPTATPTTSSPTTTTESSSPATVTESRRQPTNTRTETPESVVTPNQSATSSPTGTQPTDATGPGFTFIHLLIVLCGALVIVHRRTSR